MPQVFTIPAHVPFLDALAAELLRREPEDLADTLVLLPSRRACLALRDALARRAGDRVLLLPRMQPVGEIEADELLLDPETEAELLPALAPLRRHLLLTRLVLAREEGAVTHEQAIRLAAELTRFLDEVATESTPLEKLDGLVQGELAEHWRQTLDFLKLLAQVWPEVVAEQGRIDPAERRNRLLAAWAARWTRQPPETPVIAAGVTGSIPKVAELLAVVARLPRGCLVLPALDQTIEDAGWAEVGPNHPQYCLKRLLEKVDIGRDAVRPWPAEAVAAEAGGPPERARLLAEAMRPAAASDGRHGVAPPSPEALTGLEIATAPDLAGEALQLALRIRDALETPGRRVALVTSDRNLARRVAVELARWGVRADDSAGVPLDQSPPGSFLLLTTHCVVGDGQPVPLLSALKHPLASGGTPQGEFRRKVRALERALLRGPRRGGIAALVEDLRAWPEDVTWHAPVTSTELADWLDRLHEASRPFRALVALGEDVPLAALLEAHLAFAEALAADEDGSPAELWAREAGTAAHRFVAELREAAAVLGLVPASAYPALLAVLMARETVRPRAPAHPRVAILGQLESRLSGADLVLVGGLNEGVWPRRAESGPWLSRPMRAEFGLPPAELQVGIAAHDLLMAASAREVVLSRARKDEGGTPTVPSRWMARLEAMLAAAGMMDAVRPDRPWAAWAEALDTPAGPPAPCARPRPSPPLHARPRELWATDVENLMRDPYAVYARRILGLRPLDGLDADPGLPERGQVIHAALEAFVSHPDCDACDDPLALLRRLGEEHFARHARAPQVRALWWPRFLGVAEWFVARHLQRRGAVAVLKAEVRGTFDLDLPGGGKFRLRARADRVEVRHDGGLAIIDYKTGTVPSATEVRSGVRPQLLVEAMIAQAGGFDGVPAGRPAEVLYWGLKGGEAAAAGLERNPATATHTLPDILTGAREGLAKLLAHFDDPASAYVAVPRPEIAPTYNAYEHLARVAEWRDAAGEES